MARVTLAQKKAATSAALTAEVAADDDHVVDAAEMAAEPRTPFVDIAYDLIRPDPDNARKTFDAEALEQLAETINSHGLLQPLVVTPADAEGIHTLIAGERRLRAIEILIIDGGWAKDRPIPCRIETAEDQARMEAALIENLQRVDLNHMEAGLAFETLGSRYHLSNKQIAGKIGRSPEYVQQHRRLAGLDDDQQALVRSGDMTLHDAIAILAKPKPKDLGAATMLMLAEIYHACKHSPTAKIYNFYGVTECAHDAGGGELEQLINRRLVSVDRRHHETRRAYVSLNHGAAIDFGKALEWLEQGADLGWVALREFQIAAHPEMYIDPFRGRHSYVTPWLNGPFELHPDAAIEIEAAKAQRAEELKAEKATAAAFAARIGEITALAEELAGDLRATQDPRVIGHLTSSIKFPLKAGDHHVADANGEKLFDLTWRIQGDDRRKLHRLLALALNLATGFGQADGAAIPQPATIPTEDTECV